MSGQPELPFLDPVPVARSTDPGTSWAAADSVMKLTEKRLAVLGLFAFGSYTDEELRDKYDATPGLPEQSDSGLRTRRSELVTMGLLLDSGITRLNRAGRNCIVWEKA